MVGGDTCENREYLRWVLELQKQGFEIGLHNATYHTSLREETIRGLNRFKELFGHEPRSLAQHTICAENIYWGAARTSGAVRLVYNLLTRFRGRHFGGHVETSPLFWGDICRERVSYVRNFVFDEINTLRACPFMPYYDPARPFVRSWYAAAEGPEPEPFTKMLSEDRQDRLEDEGGACIMYTHFGKDFYSSEGLHPRFQDLMKRLSRKNGWFVPVGELLDYLVVLNGVHAITASERNWLERRWLLHKLHTRGTS
ncbi:MAG: hypothetical protein M1541_19345 [Acidobacteria bacterium]|nr:hypothetical protein [Acidobacteriota bacterium]